MQSNLAKKTPQVDTAQASENESAEDESETPNPETEPLNSERNILLPSKKDKYKTQKAEQKQE